MRDLTPVGQTFIALAMIVFGVQHFIYLELVTRAFPPLPQWLPAHAIFACTFGAFLCATGVSILLKKNAHTMSLLLAGTILLMFVLFLLPALIMSPTNGFIWTNSGKALVLTGVNLIVAGSFSASANAHSSAAINQSHACWNI